MKWIKVFFSFFPTLVWALRITEVYYGGNLLISDTERYLEIFNDQTEAVDMRRIILLLPRSDTSVISNTLLLGNFLLFDGEARTNEWILLPGERAVVISEDYNNGGRLLSFDKQTLLFRPRSKTAWSYSWENRLHLLALIYDGREVFRADGIPSRIVQKGMALTCVDGMWREDIPRPGQKKAVRIFSERVVPARGLVSLRVEALEEYSNIVVERYPSGEKEDISFAGNPLFLWGGEHGETWIVRCGGESHKIRFLDTNLSSPWAGKLLISELVSEPKRDYSGGGWTGEDGGGTINENDDWMELANVSGMLIHLSNWYIEHITSQGSGYRAIRLRYESSLGPVSNTGVSSKALGIVSVEKGLANKATIILYDGHPLWGRRVAMLSYGTQGIPSGESDNEPLSLQRLPHNVSEQVAIWRALPPTYGKVNGNAPFLVFFWDETNHNILRLFFTDPDSTKTHLLLLARSECDKQEITLYGEDGLWHGVLAVGQEENHDMLRVKNGGKNVLIYTNEKGAWSWEFVWKKKGWEFPAYGETLSDVVVYPNPVTLGREILVTGVMLGSSVVIFDEQGRVMKTISSCEEEYVQWQPEKRGLYCVLCSYGGKSVRRWFMVK